MMAVKWKRRVYMLSRSRDVVIRKKQSGWVCAV